MNVNFNESTKGANALDTPSILSKPFVVSQQEHK